MRILIAFIITTFFCTNLFGQHKIQGSIKSTKGEGISNINILIYLPNTKTLIAFAVSDQNGSFETIVNSPSDSLDIEVSSIQFRKEYRTIANTSQTLAFELVYDTKQLDTFVVKSTPIRQKNDTLSYLVSTFARKEDRAIEDVLRRMPGIEVEDNGQILYQGLPLQKFYVEGLDLMDGRYTVISKNLPQGTVSTVEILENHQPIKLLEDRIESHQASLNLKLKKDITMTGAAKLGTGLSPFLWDANVTPMIFSRNLQVVTSYQSNNTGKDVARQLNRYTFQNIINAQERPTEKPGLLSIQSANTPQIEQNRYLDNKIHLFNFNGLLLLSNSLQLRTNIYYINDVQRQEAIQYRSLFTPTDTLSFSENINNKYHYKYLNTEFTLSRNSKKNYLENKLKIQSRWDEHSGLIIDDHQSINQSLESPLKSFSNELQSINPIGKQLVQFHSYISYDHSPHQLKVNPGSFEAVLNQNDTYDEAAQHTDLKRFFIDHSANLVLGWKNFTISPKLGFSYRKQKMESYITTDQRIVANTTNYSFNNQLEGQNSRAYLQTDIVYRKQRLTISVSLPFSWRHVSLSDKSLEKKQTLNRVLFDPGISFYYKLAKFWKIQTSWRYSNRLGDIDRINYGYILQSYRSLNQHAAPLAESTTQLISARIEYRNPITSFFNILSYAYSSTNNNLLFSRQVAADGTSVYQAQILPNTSRLHIIHGQTSKYFASLKSTLSFQANYSLRLGESLLNEELFNTSTKVYNFQPEVFVKLYHWMNAEYSLDANYIKTFIEEEQKSNLSILKHKFSFFAFPKNNQLINFSAEYYNYDGTNNYFVDFMYRYTFTKSKIDLEFRWNNVFNTKTYVSYQASAFSVWESIYFLRPSQIYLSVKFRF